MTEFLTVDTSLPPYLIFPRFLLDMELNETTKLLYMILLDQGKALPEKRRLDRCIRSCVPLLYDRSNGQRSPQKPDDHQNITGRTGKQRADPEKTPGRRTSQPDLCKISQRCFQRTDTENCPVIRKRESGGPLSLWKLSECIPVSKRTGERQADRPQLAGLYRAFIRLHGFHRKAVPEPCSHHHQLGAAGQSPFPAKIL